MNKTASVFTAVIAGVLIALSLHFLNNGPDNGYKYLLDSNLDFDQDLWMLAKTYPDAYYIDWDHCSEPVSGMVAISANDLQGLGKEIRGCYTWLKQYRPIDKIGYSVFIFNISSF